MGGKYSEEFFKLSEIPLEERKDDYYQKLSDAFLWAAVEAGENEQDKQGKPEPKK